MVLVLHEVKTIFRLKEKKCSEYVYFCTLKQKAVLSLVHVKSAES